MTNDTTATAERLREIVVDLEVAREHERQLRQEATALLDGLKALTEAKTPEEVFLRLLEALRAPLGFDNALVMRPIDGQEGFRVDVSTDKRFHGLHFPLAKTLKRALGGTVTTHFDANAIPEWQSLPEELRTTVGSALLLSLKGESGRALVVFVRAEARAFQGRHEQLAKRFQPLAVQALRDVERTALLARRNRDMRAVLDNVAQGLVMVDRERKIVGERTALIDAWFGPVAPEARLEDIMARDPAASEMLPLAWEALVEDFLPMEILLQQLPRRVVADEKTLRVDYRPVPSSGPWTHVLVVFSDITAELERERAEAAQREFAGLVRSFVHDRRGFESFFGEADRLIEELSSGLQPIDVQLRALHTLKANASLFSLHSFSALVHRVEDSATGAALPASAFATLIEAWEGIRSDLAPLRNADRGIEISERDLASLVEAHASGAGAQALVERVLGWRTEPVRATLARLAEQAKAIAMQFGKGPIDVDVEADDLRLPGDAGRAFLSSLAHVVRNAVDHGLEAPEERVAAGKSASGRLLLRARQSHASLTVTISDDGRGIDWQALAVRGVAKGLPSTTHAELVERLFTDGISTREAVTKLSGRGVGLGVTRAACHAMSGRVEVTSRPGRGTTFEFAFPSEARGPNLAAETAFVKPIARKTC